METLSGVTERNTFVLRRVGTDRFATELLPFDGDVITHRVLEASGQTWVAGLARKGDETFFEVIRLDDCARSTARVLLSSMPLKIAHLTAPRPNDTTFIGPPIEGSVLLPVSTRNDESQLAVYDGKTVQIFKVDFSAATVSERDWSIR